MFYDILSMIMGNGLEQAISFNLDMLEETLVTSPLTDATFRFNAVDRNDCNMNLFITFMEISQSASYFYT